tara:strand:+ start:198 stop:704 length:507 start_codon:yes stop_codon:yes gene_type:complete
MIKEEAEQKYKEAFNTMWKVCKDQNWGDPFNYNRAKEIYTSIELKHLVSTKYAGADAIDEDGEAEYKSTIQNRINGAYKGISRHETWEEQVEYLKTKKIAKYKNHYFARFDRENMTIAECWRLSGDTVLEILLPKLEKQFFSKTKRKDPRLEGTVSMTKIKKYGEQLI